MLKVSDLTKNWYRVSEVGDLIGRSSATVTRYAKQGMFSLNRLEDRGWYYIPRSDLIEYLLDNGMIYDDTAADTYVAIYARVSSQDQKITGDLDRQISNLVLACQGERVQVFSDVASGLNDKRPGLQKLFSAITNGDVSRVVITDKDRLTRFGYSYLEYFFAYFGVTIDVINDDDESSADQELVDDMMGLIASFSGRFYGLRSAKKRQARDVIDELDEGEE